MSWFNNTPRGPRDEYGEAAVLGSTNQPLSRLTVGLMVAAIVAAGIAAPALGAEDSDPDEVADAPVTVRDIVFPVAGSPTFWNDWHAPRDNGERLHLGNDIAAPKLTPALAATDATVLRVGVADEGRPGNYVILIDSEGWEYAYFHLNNDTPGTDDDANPQGWALMPGIEPGVAVKAGEAVGYVGDSGNAETTSPHLHFEIRSPGGTQIDPHESLVAAWARDPDRACDASPMDGSLQRLPTAQPRLIVDSTGKVVSVDGALHRGDLAAFTLDEPIVAAALTVSGNGYWLLGADGGVFSFGDAEFHGSLRSGHRGFAGAEGPADAAALIDLLSFDGRIRAVDIVASPTTNGYWIVLENGLALEFGGTARLVQPPVRLAAPAVQLALNTGGSGMWLLASDGGVFGLLGAPYHGSIPQLGHPTTGAVAMMPTATGDGYGIVDTTGQLFEFGNYSQPIDGATQCVVGEVAAVVPYGPAGHQVLTTSGRIRGVGSVTSPRDDLEVLDAVDVLATRWP